MHENHSKEPECGVLRIKSTVGRHTCKQKLRNVISYEWMWINLHEWIRMNGMNVGAEEGSEWTSEKSFNGWAKRLVKERDFQTKRESTLTMSPLWQSKSTQNVWLWIDHLKNSTLTGSVWSPKARPHTLRMLRCKNRITRMRTICFTRHKIHLLIATTCLGKGLFDDAGPERSVRSTRSRPSQTVAVGRHDIINDHGPPGTASRGLDGVPVVDSETMWKWWKT